MHFGRDEEFMTDELPIRPVLNFLVKEGIALDRDKAKQVIISEIGRLARDGMISYGEFSSIFCRGIFKQALIRSAETFNSAIQRKSGQISDLNLRQRIDNYKRGKMVAGLMEEGTDKN